MLDTIFPWTAANPSSNNGMAFFIKSLCKIPSASKIIMYSPFDTSIPWFSAIPFPDSFVSNLTGLTLLSVDWAFSKVLSVQLWHSMITSRFLYVCCRHFSIVFLITSCSFLAGMRMLTRGYLVYFLFLISNDCFFSIPFPITRYTAWIENHIKVLTRPKLTLNQVTHDKSKSAFISRGMPRTQGIIV